MSDTAPNPTAPKPASRLTLANGLKFAAVVFVLYLVIAIVASLKGGSDGPFKNLWDAFGSLTAMLAWLAAHPGWIVAFYVLSLLASVALPSVSKFILDKMTLISKEKEMTPGARDGLIDLLSLDAIQQKQSETEVTDAEKQKLEEVAKTTQEQFDGRSAEDKKDAEAKARDLGIPVGKP